MLDQCLQQIVSQWFCSWWVPVAVEILKPPGPLPCACRFNMVYPYSKRFVPASLRFRSGRPRCHIRDALGLYTGTVWTRLNIGSLLTVSLNTVFATKFFIERNKQRLWRYMDLYTNFDKTSNYPKWRRLQQNTKLIKYSAIQK